MKPRFLILILSLLYVLPGLAFPAEKSVIIGFRQKPGPSEQELIHGAKGRIERTHELIPAMTVSISEKEIAKLRKDRKIAYIEDNAIYSAEAQPLPGQEYENSWGALRVFADVSHVSGNRGTGVRIAILDTGIDYNHVELAANYRGGYDFVFDDADPFDDSFNSHGTHVAGIIGAQGNGIGIIGVAPESDLFAVKVLDGGGFGTADWIIAGIEWAVKNGIEIINMSIAGPDSQALHEACDSAYESGVLLVAAGGNSLAGAGSVEYPAGYDSVIAVTGTDLLDLPGFSSPRSEKLELSAPGVDILSTVAGGSYDFLSGTSQAAAHVTGVAALYTVVNTEDANGDGLVNGQDTRLILQAEAIDLGEAGKDDTYGYGLASAAGASLDPQMALTIMSTGRSPKLDMQHIQVAGSPYKITIMNSGLARVVVNVFEGGVLRKDLSSSIKFSRRKSSRANVWLDATGARYSIQFSPYGKRDTSAEIILNSVSSVPDTPVRVKNEI